MRMSALMFEASPFQRPLKKKPPLFRGTEFSDDHRVRLLQGAQELFPALVEAMDAARQVVHLETYIFEFAGSALSVAEALERAARRGVLVRRLHAAHEALAHPRRIM